jgi:hypothetical protein
MRIILLLALAAAAFSIPACKSSPKSSARIYEGDGPNIQFSESRVGGPAQGR